LLDSFSFVDDVLLFYDGSWMDASKLKILDLYCIATGMKVNLQKSSISFNKDAEDQINVIYSCSPINLLNSKEG
jgi:hypothetical protein